MSLSESTITTVKATIPVLRAHAVDITSRMYENLFEKYPHTRSLFGAAPEDQPNILAAAITAYAVNIDNLDSLSEAVSRMASAHVRTNVRPEHYPMVADALLSAMEDVLGEAATPEILNAWEEAYFFLAEILIEEERARYARSNTA